MSNAKTILIVDDSDSVRSGVCRILTHRGYQILEARDGEEAFELCRNHQTPIDVLVTDFVLPGISGLELVQQIKSISPVTRILLVSGYAPTVIGIKNLGSNVAFLSKPFLLKELVGHVQLLLAEEAGQ